jgi:tetratricopeptide (TPR) repeat protein
VAFEALLGARYIFRAEVPDYKVDASLEEVDSTGSLTGLRFLAQLKGTDEPDLDKALRFSMAVTDRLYYRALPLPVLMVRYHAPTAATYTRWIHQHDPFRDKPGAATFTFRWELTDLWDARRSDELAADARAFLELRSPMIHVPRTFHVATQGAFGLSRMEVVAALRTAVSRAEDVIALRTSAPPAGAAWVHVTENEVTVDLAKVTGATMHVSAGYDPGSRGQRLAADAWLTAGAAFASAGQVQISARLVAAFAADSGLVRSADTAFAMQDVMARARRVRESLELAALLDASEDAEVQQASMFFILPALFHGASLSASEYEEHRKTLEARIARRDAAEAPTERARELVNLANLYRTRGVPNAAIPLYEEAARCDPGYLERAHYWFELGGVLFGARRFAESATAYARASRLGGPQIAQALEADALLFDGEYQTALELLRDFTRDHPMQSAEYRLKLLALETIVGELSISSQQRDTEAALHVASALPERDATVAEILAVSEAQLNSDALWPSAWLNRGLAYLAGSHEYNALSSFVAGSILMPHVELELWRRAILVAFRLDERDTVADLLVTARRLAGPAIMHKLVEWAGRQAEDFPVDELLSTVDNVLDEAQTHFSPGFTVRILGDGGDVKEISVPSLRSPDDRP